MTQLSGILFLTFQRKLHCLVVFLLKISKTLWEFRDIILWYSFFAIDQQDKTSKWHHITVENGEVIVEMVRSRHGLLNFPILNLKYYSYLTLTPYFFFFLKSMNQEYYCVDGIVFLNSQLCSICLYGRLLHRFLRIYIDSGFSKHIKVAAHFLRETLFLPKMKWMENFWDEKQPSWAFIEISSLDLSEIVFDDKHYETSKRDCLLFLRTIIFMPKME